MKETLQKDQVDIWTIQLDQADNVINALYWHLSDEEKNQFVRFRYSQERKRFIVCHGAVRQILAMNTGKPINKLQIEENPFGKPVIWKKDGGVEIQFNYSHSENLAVCAVSPTRNVGVDIEFIHPFIDMDQMVAQYFSYEENAYFQSVDSKRKLRTFFTIWCRKEAFTKAIGRGFSHPLNEFTMLDGRSSAHFKPVKLGWRTALAGYWFYTDLKVHDDYACTLVVEGEGILSLKHHDWVMNFNPE
jgi:4'-phosphopantetheinyl transferase